MTRIFSTVASLVGLPVYQPGELAPAPQPEPPQAPKPGLEPIEATKASLVRAANAMTRERDDLDAQIRTMAERSRQLNVSIIALDKAIGDLDNHSVGTALAKAVADANGQ